MVNKKAKGKKDDDSDDDEVRLPPFGCATLIDTESAPASCGASRVRLPRKNN